MNLLLGVIPPHQDTPEQLLVLENGQLAVLQSDSSQATNRYPNYDFLRTRTSQINHEPVSGPGVFDFRYGPVTSGVREAGCFHLYTYGERILRAAIDIRWKRRRIEEGMKDVPMPRAQKMAEQVCGNFGFSHSLAFSRAAEMALGLTPDTSTTHWRILFLEAERIFNHLHLVYRLALAAAQKVLATHLAALFEEALRLNYLLTGSRYLLGINGIGQLNKYPAAADCKTAVKGYEQIAHTFRRLYETSLANYNYLDRLHAAGTLTAKSAQELGLTGPSLRACGVDDQLELAEDHGTDLPAITQAEGDALARMEIRAAEIAGSCRFLTEQLSPNAPQPSAGPPPIAKQEKGTGYGLANSPSGALTYFLRTTHNRIQTASIFTPSYVGLRAVSTSLEGLVFTDFPFVFDSFGVHFADAAR